MACLNGNRETFLCVFSVVAILINLACLIFVSNKLANLSLEGDVQVTDEVTDNGCICVPCAFLTNAITLIESLETKVGNKKCCACSAKQAGILMELLTQDRYSEPAHFEKVENPDLKYVSAHKSFEGPIFKDTSFPKDSNVALRFNTTQSEKPMEHALNVEVIPSGLVIQYSGMYKVYSEVHFGPNTNKSCKEFDVKTWEQAVVRMRPNERQSSGVLARSLHTCCDKCSREKESTYAAGVFYLKAGDHLHVEVSGQGLVRFRKDSSFLGVAMLGSS